MSIDVEKLLAPVDAGNPVGADLSYDPSMMEIEQLAAGKPEQQVGDTIVAAEDPDWKDLRSRCTEAMSKTKDLRWRCTCCWRRSDGWAEGLRTGWALVRGCWKNTGTRFIRSSIRRMKRSMLRMNIISTLTDR